MTRKTIWIAAAIVGLLIIAVIVYAAVPRGASYSLYGTEIISTTASGDQLGTLLTQTAWTMGDTNDLGGGRKHFPSFHQGGQSWNDKDGKIIATRGITEFDARNGSHCTIETVFIPGRPTLLLLKADDSQATMDLANEVMRQFQLLKVRHRGP